ncbi:MAG TPA: CocE/NonD family hydrolase [Povalibacter sp.]|uniref:CocE/NonD family hydrolase n=1 Tax=Povalibacter sp. TaxID=1962978 RepID=UPI002CE615AF|nr:CocE/NonD family hydrolase [Povalibacter sp.]HMN46129.1 CocE/NonD family hydrolase [Povalibacter sp.]
MPRSSFVRELRLVACCLLFFIAGATPAHAQSTAAANPAKPAFTEEFATMRDGVKLAANVFLPGGQGPFPVVLTRTPYLKDGPMSSVSRKYIDAGYAFVVQDVRGKGHSQGEYRPFVDDRNDGYDTVEWVARQSWSNGKVGMTGASALGITANLAASAAPPSLVAAYVVVAPHSRFEEVTFMGGVVKEADTVGWMKRQGAGDQVPPLLKRVIWDERWNDVEFHTHLDRVKIPMYNVGGWYDIFNIGNLRNFAYLQNRGAPGAKGNQKLLMGPFGHGALSGDLQYPQAGDIRSPGGAGPDQELRWFEYWLKGIDNGIMREPPVRYYRMAAARKGEASANNEYQTADNWPPQFAATRYYLQQDGGLATHVPKARKASTTYDFDPAHPVKTFGGANLTFERGPMDQRAVGQRQDYLRFSTGPLSEPVAITGPVTAELWVATDGLDTDFMAKLVDVYPDGYEALVLDAPIRLRYRNGRMKSDDAKMMTPGKPEKVTIDLWATSLLFEKGHRIALHVTSSNSPRFDVNDNSGTAPGEPPQLRVAKNTVYFDRDRPSALVLPVTAP